MKHSVYINEPADVVKIQNYKYYGALTSPVSGLAFPADWKS